MCADLSQARTPNRAAPRRLVIAGALHLDEVARPVSPLVPRSSNPVGWTWRAGGVAGNVALAAAQAGTLAQPPVLVAVVGDDATGRWLDRELTSRGVETHVRRLAGRSTGRYTAVLDHSGELHIGLADTALAEQLDWAYIARTLQTVCSDAGADDVLVLDANLSVTTWQQTCQALPASAAVVGLPVSVAKAPRLQTHLARIDLLVLNRLEAATLTGLATDSTPHALLDALSAAGTRDCVLTDGADAVTVQSAQQRCTVDVPAVTIEADVNGAGDAFTGALLAAWLAGRTLPDAVVDFALPAARATLQTPTASTSYHAAHRPSDHDSP